MKNNIAEDVKTEKEKNAQTLYFCSLHGCSFSTTKQKMSSDHVIINHLKKDHGLTKENIMRNMLKERGIYRFKRIKKSMENVQFVIHP